MAEHAASFPAGGSTNGYSVLLSAYACEPGLGSEQAVGWGWAVGLGRRCRHITVITRESNRARIEAWRRDNALPNVEFHYCDLPRWQRFWKRGNTGVHLYYFLWQVKAYRLARMLARTVKFDVVHHVTFVNMRMPSFMGRLGLPFIFGPVAGGEYSPRALWWRFPWRERLGEMFRWLSMSWIRVSPFMVATFRDATLVLATSEQTAALVPLRYRSKTRQMLAVSFDEPMPESKYVSASRDDIEIVFAGHCQQLKGMEFGLRAFARAAEGLPRISLTIVGTGPALPKWKDLVQELGVNNRVRWRAPTSRAAFLESLSRFDVMLFPSLHDSGGLVVLEALAAGLPVICLDVGGPGLIVDDTCGIKVQATDGDQVVDGLESAIRKLAVNGGLRDRLSVGARQRIAEQFTLDTKVDRMLMLYGDAVHASR